MWILFKPPGRWAGVLLYSAVCLSMSGPGAMAQDLPVQPSLRTWLDQLMQQHPLQKAAEARQQAALAQSRALQQPTLQSGGGGGWLSVHRATPTRVGVSQSIDISGKRAARRNSGQALVAQASIDRAVQSQALAVQALQALSVLQHELRNADLTTPAIEACCNAPPTLPTSSIGAGDIGVLDRDLAALAQAEALAQQGGAELSLLKAQQQLGRYHASSGAGSTGVARAIARATRRRGLRRHGARVARCQARAGRA